MSKAAPGKYYRKGISLMQAMERFGDNEKAEAWLVECRWPDGIRCAYCDGENVAKRTSGRLTQQYYCKVKTCGRKFTVKTGTVMHDSRLPLSKWAVAFYLYNTSLKGVSSMKLHRDLGITQKTAWYLAHRIPRDVERRDGEDGRAGRGGRDLHRWQRGQQAR